MDCERVARETSAWIAQQLARAGRSRAVLGVSGGVDSAVVAALTKRACPDGTLALVLPAGKADDLFADRARRVCEQFDIPWELVNIGPILTLYSQWVPLEQRENAPDRAQLALANLRPRIRMTLLYLFANTLGGLVVGTGNKSELAVGYFTKYGDGGVDILPIGGLYKSEVVALARFLGVPQDIIEAPPSGGLWEGQTDEGEMAVTYDQIETYLRACAETHDPRLPADVVSRIQRLASTSQHKRQPPVAFVEVRQFID